MALGLAAYRDFLSRLSTPRSHIVDYFLRKQSDLGLDEARSYLSIGPAHGSLDLAALKAFPKCNKYIGVDPSSENMTQLEIYFEKLLPAIKRQLVIAEVQDWSGPEEPVDIIMVSHVLYYFPDTTELMSNIVKWLKPGGLLLILHCGEKTGLQDFLNKILGNFSRSYLAKNVKKVLQPLCVDIIDEYSHDFTIDVRSKTKDLANFFTLKDCTEEEATEVYQFLDDLGHSGQPPCDEDLLVVRKKTAN